MTPERADVTVHRDVVHTPLEGYRPLALDLYLPARPVAGCLYLHGGGWLRGSRREGPGPLRASSQRYLARLATHGLAVASVDYRLSGESSWPAQLDDVAAAFRWWRSDETYGLKSLSLGIFGVSAGGQLACVSGLEDAFELKSVVAWYPVTDLSSLPEDIRAAGGEPDPGPGSREARLLGAPAAEVPDLAASASAVARVRAGAPPYLLLHGTADTAVPPAQSRRLHDALVAVGDEVTLQLVEGYDHMFVGMPEEHLDRLVDRTAAFLLSHAG